MEIQVHTDRHVAGDQALISFVASEVVTGLGPCAARVTSIEVHLAEASGARKGPPDLRCLVEARPSGHAPLAVTHRATTTNAAVRGAVSDMRAVLERMFRRLDTQQVRSPSGAVPAEAFPPRAARRRPASRSRGAPRRRTSARGRGLR